MFCFLAFLSSYCCFSQPSISVPEGGAKWEQSYQYDAYNQFRVEYYPKNCTQPQVREYKTYFQTKGDGFYVKLINDKKGNLAEALFDKMNQSVIQIFANIDNIPPLYNVGKFYFPPDSAIRKLDLIATSDEKFILDVKCRKYNYTYKKVVGEIWITDSLKFSNDIGVLRASKMIGLHNKLSVDGWVMEMKFLDSNGGTTILNTVAINLNEPYLLDLSEVNMTVIPSRINYYVF